MEELPLLPPAPIEPSFYLLPWQEKGLKIVLILAGALIFYLIFRALARKILPQVSQKRLKTLLSLAYNVVTILIVFIVGLIILDQFEVNVTPILASAGIAGLAIGFGAQTLVRDIIGGLFLLSEDQIRIGDLVKIGAFEGTVERIGVRSLVLRDMSGNITILPNSQVATVVNMTRDFSQVDLLLGVSTKHKVDEVLKVIKGVCDQIYKNPNLKDKILSPPEVLGVEEIAGAKMSIRVIIKTKPKKQFNIARELRYQIKKAFEEKGFDFA
jgi:small conductance mechanosensitive channel